MILRRAHLSLVFAAAGLLAACDLPGMGPVVPTPRERPAASPQSPESLAQAEYFARVQRGLLTQGLLRRDGGGPDVPFTAAQLARNFMAIAFFEEYSNAGGTLVAKRRASRMHRWEIPITMSVTFGASIPPTQRARDEAEIARFTDRLARLTGIPITLRPAGGNFQVLILNEDERRDGAALLRSAIPGISQPSIDAALNMTRSTFCLVFAADPEGDGTYGRAVAVIRGEHPDLLRMSCIHEEIAQGMGLSNDSPAARPSIFNDDEEFGLLTSHDEMLLRILYDTRLSPGMTAQEARPIVYKIAAELVGGAV